MAEIQLSTLGVDYSWDTRVSPVKGQYVEIVTPLKMGTITFYLKHVPRGMQAQVIHTFDGREMTRAPFEGIIGTRAAWWMEKRGDLVLFKLSPYEKGWNSAVNIIYSYQTIKIDTPADLKSRRPYVGTRGKNTIFERFISRTEETFAYKLRDMPKAGSVKVTRQLLFKNYQELPPSRADDDLQQRQFRVYYTGDYKQYLELHTEPPDVNVRGSMFVEVRYEKEPAGQTAAEVAAEAARLEAIKKAEDERKRLEAEQKERERIAAEQKEKERLEAERIERERIAVEAEKARLAELARLEAIRKAAEQKEKERLEALKKAEDERKRLAAEQLARERERERLAAIEKEKERLAAIKKAEEDEKARLAAIQKAEDERKRLAAEQLARERERERLERERIERERIAAEQKAEAARLERERLAAIKKAEDEKARLDAERVERERLERERLERERLAAEQIERDRIAKEKADEAARLEEEARLEREQLERERERLAAEQRAEDERIRIANEAARLERERLEAAGKIEFTDESVYTKKVYDGVTEVIELVSLVVEQIEGVQPEVTKLLRFKLKRIPARGRISARQRGTFDYVTEADGAFGEPLKKDTFRVQYDGMYTSAVEINVGSYAGSYIEYTPAAALVVDTADLRTNPLSGIANNVNIIETFGMIKLEHTQEVILRERIFGDVKVYDRLNFSEWRRELTRTFNKVANEGEFILDAKTGRMLIHRFSDAVHLEDVIKDYMDGSGMEREAAEFVAERGEQHWKLKEHNFAVEYIGGGCRIDASALNSIWRGKNKSMTDIVKRKFTTPTIGGMTDCVMLNGKIIAYGKGNLFLFEKSTVDAFIWGAQSQEEHKLFLDVIAAKKKEDEAEAEAKPAWQNYTDKMRDYYYFIAWGTLRWRFNDERWEIKAQKERDTIAAKAAADIKQRKYDAAKNERIAAEEKAGKYKGKLLRADTQRAALGVHAAPMVVAPTWIGNRIFAILTSGEVAWTSNGTDWSIQEKMKLPSSVNRGALSAVIGDDIYIIDGVKVWRWDLKLNNGWKQKQELPRRAVGGTAAVYDGKIYVIGAAGPLLEGSPDILYYTPENDEWTFDTAFQKAMIKEFGGQYIPSNYSSDEGLQPEGIRAIEVNGALWLFGGSVSDGIRAKADRRIFAYKNNTVQKIGETYGTNAYGAVDTGRHIFVMSHDMYTLIQKPEENFAIQIGAGAKASNLLSIAIGTNAEASANSAVAFGFGAKSANENTIVIGNDKAVVKTQNGNITTISDRRDKADLELSSLGLDFIRGLKPSMYKMANGNRTHHGFIAQDVLALQREKLKDDAGILFAAVKELSSDRLVMDYREFIPVLVKAAQELSDKIDIAMQKRNMK